jgi:flagellar biosynthesis protein FliR
MTVGNADLIGQLPAWAFMFALVLCRTGAACMLIPGCGEAEVPAVMRASFAAVLTVLLLPVLAPNLPGPPAGIAQELRMVAAELTTGLFLGWLARLAMLAMPLAGQFIAVVAGHASVLQPDAVLGSQGAAVGRLLALAAPVLVLATGLHMLPLAALAGSYRVIPAGAFLPAGDTVQAIVMGVAEMFALSVRLATPFILAGIVWHVTLAVVSRLVPHLQVFFLAAPAQLLGGLVLLGALGAALLGVWREQASAIFGALPGLQGVGQ